MKRAVGASVSDLLASHKRATKRRRKRRAGDSVSGSDVKMTVEQLVRKQIGTSGRSIVRSEQLSSQPNEQPLVVFILFIIIDSLPFEDIWRHWLMDSEVDGSTKGGTIASKPGFTTKVLIHAKFPEKVKSDWVCARLIKESFKLP